MSDIAAITRKRDLLPTNDSQFNSHNRRNEMIVGRKVEIGAGRVCDQFSSCTFKDCEIRLLAAGHLVGVATHRQIFRDCFIWASKPQRIPTWEATFERCYFRGKFETRFTGPVCDCDFSDAKFTYAAFLQIEPLGQVVWPKWPHIVLDSPSLNHRDWFQTPLPDDFNKFVIPRTGIAAVFNIIETVGDPEAMWELIRHKNYVHTLRDTAQPDPPR